MGLRAWVDHDECVSSGACVLEAPEIFAYQEGPEALAVVRSDAPEVPDERLGEVAQLCPVGAIHLLDEDGAEVPLEQ